MHTMKNQSDQATRRTSLGGTNFLVSIHHQQNHSWQGSIQWLDTGQKVHFRSELELLGLMQEAIARGQGAPEEQRTWGEGKSKKTG